MPARSGTASHVPSRPAFFEGTAMVGHVVAQPRHDLSIGSARNAIGEEAWHPERDRGIVAAETTVLASEPRYGGPRLLEHVEHGTLLWVLHCHFDESSTHPRDGHRIVEEDRPRVRGADPVPLKARLRENGEL